MPYRHVLPAGTHLLNAACLQTDLVASPELVEEVHASITAINAGAEVIHTSHSRLDLTRVLNRGAFNPSQTSEDVSHLSLQLCGAQISPASNAVQGAGNNSPPDAPLPSTQPSTGHGNAARTPEAKLHDSTEQQYTEDSRESHGCSGYAQAASGEQITALQRFASSEVDCLMF